jgi:hypothetical protein
MDENLLKRVEYEIFLDILEISDIKFQKKVWLDESKEPIFFSSYAEVMCRLFNDNQYEYFIEKYTTILGYPLSFQKKLYDLKDELANYNKEDNKSDLEIINDTKWHEISKLAKSITNEWTNLAELINFHDNDMDNYYKKLLTLPK